MVSGCTYWFRILLEQSVHLELMLTIFVLLSPCASIPSVSLLSLSLSLQGLQGAGLLDAACPS